MNAPVLPEIRKGRKFDQVLSGAWQVFLQHGYEGASVDDIARSAGVSKATLYSYFPDKRLLFLEVAKAECRRQADHAMAEIDMDGDIAQALTIAARHLLGFFLSDFGQQIFRICIAESQRFPELGQGFYDSGPGNVRETLGKFIEELTRQGRLKAEDPYFAAEQFGELCKVHIFPRLMCGTQTSFSEQEVSRVIQGAVDMFMARYGV